MNNQTKKHKTRIPGVTVTVNPSGSFTVKATAAAVQAWPWDFTHWPCASLRKPHRFTFEANGDLCDMETSQADSRDGSNAQAVSALADDCRELGLDLISGLAEKKPPCVSSIIFDPLLPHRGNQRCVDCFTFVFRYRRNQVRPGFREYLGTCISGRSFSNFGEARTDWVNSTRSKRVTWEAVPADLREHVKGRLADVEPPPPPPRFKVWTRGNRGRYFPTLEAAKEAAEKVFKKTGLVLLITQEKGAAK